ncbi:MAG: hypothetical protein HY220_02455 [Candidatus Sungbacteria bacterium]|uniref:Uncharacterized protein n=1 Tax=Candidatus Sungiibacteriota bacterium TaxID=2750080 RepID=A0A9D6LPX8_9BACT|nr:hypothetical protein [Candidatus Sungbacteria bacterium]
MKTLGLVGEDGEITKTKNIFLGLANPFSVLVSVEPCHNLRQREPNRFAAGSLGRGTRKRGASCEVRKTHLVLQLSSRLDSRTLRSSKKILYSQVLKNIRIKVTRDLSIRLFARLPASRQELENIKTIYDIPTFLRM